ncbi:MAG: SH3 domain-containing protein [Pseudomonadota bacterium]
MKVHRSCMVAAVLALGITAILYQPAIATVTSFTTANVNLRAGPSTNYPVVHVIPASATITAYGCVADYAWCDISYREFRGWISAPYLKTVYNGAPVVITPAVATAIGVSVVTFNRAYWERYYVGYPWYGSWASYPVYRAPVAHTRTVVGPRGGTATRSLGCVGPRCGAAGSVNGARGGTAVGARGCGPRGCGSAVVGPRGNARVRGGRFR